jgi:thymidylate synthase
MEKYFNIVRDVLKEGSPKEDRTGVGTISIPGAMFEHNISEGFPLLTTKKMWVKSIFAELEFFIKGITSKKWLEDRSCTIWREWANPKIVPYGHDEETKKKMMGEDDLGAIYSFQYRHFGAPYSKNSATGGVDQIKEAINLLKTNPNSRRIIVTAWNPVQLDEAALPACHYGYQLIVQGDKLNLLWSQRSVDVALGLPYNIASYAMLLMLYALESGFKPGKLIGFLGDTHIYTNHIDGLKEQLSRETLELPKLTIPNFTSIFDWEYTQFEIDNYHPHPAIKFDIAV